MPENYTGTEGTAAFNAGLTIMDGNEEDRKGYLSINRVKDQLVAFVNAAVGAISLSWANITGKPATFPPSAHSHPITQITTADGSQNYGVALQGALDAKYNVSGGEITGNVVLSSGNVFVPAASAVSAGYSVAYINGDGRLGRAPSARRYKKEIRDHHYTIDQLNSIRVRDYRLKAALYGSGAGPVEVGVIAEELIEAGLSEFVFFNADGTAESVYYERLALVAIGALQEVAAGMDLLAQRIASLEAER